MAKFAMQIETAHPLLFLADSTPDTAFPAEIGMSFAVASEGCVAFAVLSFVDGATLVTVTDEACASSSPKLFSGSIAAPSGIVTLMDSSLFDYLNIPVPEGPLGINIWADDAENPDWVWVQLDAIRPV